MIKPYDYQEQAVSTCLEFVKARPEKDLLIQIPTGGGKSIVIYLLATELQRLGFNTLIITPRTRLVEQNSKYFSDIGVCSGKLGNDVFSGDISTIIGTFQTLIKREHSQVDVVLVDEAHLVPDDELSAFNSYLKEMGKPVIGFTATPFRNNQPIFVQFDLKKLQQNF
jgi:superfamily II DNA or RNA helicase